MSWNGGDLLFCTVNVNCMITALAKFFATLRAIRDC